MKKIIQHTTQFTNSSYLNLKELQLLLLKRGYKLNMGKVITGCIDLLASKGIAEEDLKFFEKQVNDTGNQEKKDNQLNIDYK